MSSQLKATRIQEEIRYRYRYRV